MWEILEQVSAFQLFKDCAQCRWNVR